MYEMKYPNLFTPKTIGKLTFRNRILAAPIGWDAVDNGCQPTMNMVDFYERKARGGAASVAMGETTVDSVNGKSMMKDIELDSPWALAAMVPVADAINKHGAIASLELMHPGHYARHSYFQGNELYGPVDKDITGGFMEGADKVLKAKEMPEDIIEGIIEKHANAALTGKTAGFDMVIINGAHGWLLSQFMSPIVNTRTDRWGGSLENRMRLPIEICKRIKLKCGQDFLIEFRMSGDEAHAGGYTINEGVEMAKAIQDYVDILHVSTGIHEDPGAFMTMCPTMFHEDHCNLKFAAEIKKNVHVPVAAVGAFSDPDQMEEVIANGVVDFISVARGLLADPDLPKKARAGHPEDITKCMRCLACFSNLGLKQNYVCALNPEIGREYENKYSYSPAEPRKVLVAGGGIGGMQAALTAAKRGHQVILCEKSDKLGGVLRCESEVSFKKNLDHYLDSQARKVIANPSIEVRLNTAATKELAQEINPDAIVAAVGARSITPSFIKGYNGENIIDAQDIYYNIEKAGKKVVILGGGLVGCELAMHLTMNGREVTILEMMGQLSTGENFLHGGVVGGMIGQMGIKLALNTKAIEVTPEGIIGEDKEGNQQVFEADTVICAVGMRPRTEVVEELRFCAPEFYQIGDCIAPATITEANKSGYYAALDIGR